MKNTNKKKITLIITIYKQSIKELGFWIENYLVYRKKIKFIFLIDNNEHKDIEEIKKVIKKKDLHIHKNMGKFLSIYTLIKEGAVKTNHFKICDPDDYILFRKISKLFLKEEKIFLFKNTYFAQEPEDKSESSLNKIMKNSVVDPSLTYPNHYTILPTKAIKEDKFFSGKRINAADDKLLAYIAIANSYDVDFIEDYFYYYILKNGNSNNKNYHNYFSNLIDTYNEIFSILKKSQKIIAKSNFSNLENYLNSFLNDESISKDEDFKEKFSELMNVIENIKNFLQQKSLVK